MAVLVGGRPERARDGRGEGVTERAIYWHLNQIYQKRSISRQVDLVRLVLSIAEFR